MTVKSLDVFASERRMVKTLPLAALKDITLGIDAEYMFAQILSAPGTKEPLLPAIGGLPFSFRTTVEAYLAAFKAAGITPVFVFQGVDIGQDERVFDKSDANARKRASAWEAYDKARGEQAVNIFNEAEMTIRPARLARYAMQILHEHGVEYMVAPYRAWAQLVYLLRHPNQYVDAIYGPHEVLLFPVDRLVLGVDAAAATFTWLNKRSILGELGNLNADQFLDVCLLCGMDLCAAFPLLDQGLHSGSMAIRTSRDLLKNYVSGYGAVAAYADNALVKGAGYVDAYKRAYCAVRHHIIWTSDGRAEPISTENVPADVHEFVTQRLPDELYFYLSKGVVGPEILSALTAGVFVDTVPLDGGDTAEYRRFLDAVDALRGQALGLFTQPLHRFYQAKRVVAVRWHDRDHRIEIPHRAAPSLYHTVADWNVRAADLPSEALADYPALVLALRDPAYAASTRTPRSGALSTPAEVLANAHWRLLQLRGFVSPTHALTPLGAGLAAGLVAAGPAASAFYDPLVTALELVRLGALTARPYTPAYDSPVRGSDHERACVLLVSRVASLLPITHRPIGFSGPLSRSMLSFNSFAAKYTEHARMLAEMVLFSLLANGDADRTALTDAWASIGTALPFAAPSNTGVGIAAKTYLNALCVDDAAVDDAARAKHKTALKSMFAHAVDIVADLERAFALWTALAAAVRAAAAADAIPAADAKSFADADAWLQLRR
ncbi:temperature dependent protein affecting M2 dsRNA replication-domain-containing protein [Dipodascopsis tothii]|uniref:temperature dependent protein affecting M2 dsRNA replication-domain-containing protein n=1 Tax=Dipodascopsis tothii TaxID=44089 RepID=UPI0034CFDA91